MSAKPTKTEHDLIEEIRELLRTAEVKTASPTRAGRSIQVRIGWTEPDGKKGLGYYGRGTLSVVSHMPIKSEWFVDDVFRVKDRIGVIERICDGISDTSWTYTTADFRNTFEELCKTDDELRRLSDRLVDEARAEMNRARTGGDKARTRHAREEARKCLAGWLDAALKAGIPDAEIKDMVKQALVRHTHEL